MNITTKETTDTSTTLLITADESDMKEAKTKAVKQLGKSIKPKGFREGKAPAKLVESSIDPNELSSAVLNEVVPNLAGRALDEQKILTAIRPEVTVTKFVPFTELEIEVIAEYVANVKLMDYKKELSHPKPQVDVTDEEVDAVVKRIQFDMSERNEVDRKSKQDDQVWIDFEGIDKDGNAVEGASGEDYPLALGSNTFIPGFEEQLVDLAAGDEKSFDITFPKDYQSAKLAGQEVMFKCTVKKVMEVTIPEITDELAKQIGPYKDAAALMADIRAKVTEDKAHKAELELESVIVGEIADGSEMDIPERMINEQLERMLEDHKSNLKYRGTTYEEWIVAEGTTPEKHAESLKAEATKRVRGGVVLSEIARAEGIEMSEDDIDQAMEQHKQQYASDPQMMMELSKPEARRDIAARMLTGQALDIIKDAVLK